jgi:hypothetical protein
MHEYWQHLSDRYDLFMQQLGLQWEAIQAQPGGITGEVLSWFVSFGQWLRTGNRGVLVLLVAIIVVTRRFLNRRG